MAPADSLARLRKALIDRAERREAPVTRLCREAGISRSRFYELRARYLAYGEAGLRPKPRPAGRPDRRLPGPLTDAIVAYAVEHPTHGERTIADALARPRFGSWRVSHGGVANVLRRAGLGRRLARLAAAESLAASEGGPLTERVLREVRAIERATDGPHRLGRAGRGAVPRHLLRRPPQGRGQGLAAVGRRRRLAPSASPGSWPATRPRRPWRASSPGTSCPHADGPACGS